MSVIMNKKHNKADKISVYISG